MTRNLKTVPRMLLLTLVASALVACGSSNSDSTSSGGGGGTPASSNAGGAAGGADSTGTTTTGAGGSSGSTTTTGSSSMDGTLCPAPQAVITDFSQEHFGSSTTLAGGEYAYPTSGEYGLTSDLSGGNWHISGNVGDYSGFGLYFDNCNRIDASAFAGISFKISGTVEQGGAITLQVATLNNAIAATWINTHGGSTKDTDPGRCLPPADSSLNQWSQSTCAQPSQIIPVTETPTTQSIRWSDFTGGLPDTSVTPSDIIGINWSFPNPDGVGSGMPTPYKVDITLDDLAFIAK